MQLIVLRWRCIGVSVCIKKKSKINKLNFYLKILEKRQTKPKTRRWKKIINNRMEIHEIENIAIIEKHQCSQNLGL